HVRLFVGFAPRTTVRTANPTSILPSTRRLRGGIFALSAGGPAMDQGSQRLAELFLILGHKIDRTELIIEPIHQIGAFLYLRDDANAESITACDARAGHIVPILNFDPVFDVAPLQRGRPQGREVKFIPPAD